MYTKDLSFLLRLLQTSRQSGILLVQAPEQDESNDSSWQGRFQLENGVVKACLVLHTRNGKILFRNDEAINWLLSQGKLEWRIEEEAQLPARPLPSSSPQWDEGTRGDRSTGEGLLLTPLWEKRRREIFQRTLRGDRAPANAFPSRDHRQVFSLIDGRRSIEEIVRLLQKPPEIVLRILQELQNAGFVV